MNPGARLEPTPPECACAAEMLDHFYSDTMKQILALHRQICHMIMLKTAMEAKARVVLERLDPKVIKKYVRPTATVEAEARVVVERLDPTLVYQYLRSSHHECPHCRRLYKTASSVRAHVALRHDKEVQCPRCEKTYRSLLSLQRHLIFMQRSGNRCQGRFRTFRTNAIFLEHKKRSVECSNKRICSYCNRMFGSSVSLRNHYNTKHPGRNTNWCAICRRSFANTLNLVNHCTANHSDGSVGQILIEITINN